MAQVEAFSHPFVVRRQSSDTVPAWWDIGAEVVCLVGRLTTHPNHRVANKRPAAIDTFFTLLLVQKQNELREAKAMPEFSNPILDSGGCAVFAVALQPRDSPTERMRCIPNQVSVSRKDYMLRFSLKTAEDAFFGWSSFKLEL